MIRSKKRKQLRACRRVNHDHDHEDEEEKEYDEHVWTSMRNAEVICDAIAETLEEMDPENKEIYQSNAETYKEKLSALDEAYQETVNNAKQKTLVFADRFPFRYLVDDYGLELLCGIFRMFRRI